MFRDKKFIIVSHCVINQNSVVMTLARAKGSFEFVKKIIDEGIGIVQLPCPEFKYLGLKREGMTKEQYNTLEYRELCKNLFIPILDDVREYLNNGYEFMGILGINESPTCSITGERGIFMEEIFKALENEGINPKIYEVPCDYEE